MRFFASAFIFSCLAFFGIASAHVIGEDSRTKPNSFPVSSKYYNSILQAEMAESNLSHIQCKRKGSPSSQNTTSGFFIDVEDFARKNGIIGDVSSCNNKVLVSVAHYILPRGGAENAQCTVRKSFKTTANSSEYGKVKSIHTGEGFNLKDGEDFAFLKIDYLRNGLNPNFNTLKICSDSKIEKSSSSICGPDDQDNIILPHLSRTDYDELARSRGFKYRAKISSGQCCAGGRGARGDVGLLSHTCDMEKRSSGAPLLRLTDDEPCVIGVQAGESIPNEPIGNYAASVASSSFKRQLTSFISANCN